MIEPAELANLELFSDIKPALLSRIAGRAGDLRPNPGEYLVNEGEPCAFYVLLSGVLEVTKRVGTREVPIAERDQAGEHFGEVPLLVGGPALAGLRAKTPARVARIEPQDFRWLLSSSKKFSDWVVAAMEQRVAGLQTTMSEEMPEVVAIAGRRWDRACHDLRDFLSRNHVPFEYFEMDDPCALNFIPELEHLHDRCPIVKIPKTENRPEALLIEPKLADLANAVGLSTAPELDTYDVAIVGGGPSGLAAAVYGATEGLRTVLFESDAPGGQAGTSSRIENYLGFPTGLSGDDLASRAYRQARRFNAEIVVTRRVEGLEPGTFPNDHAVVLDGGTRIRARAVVVSTGVSWRKLGVPGIDEFAGSGIYYGASRTEAPATSGQDIFLIGAGNSSGQAAMYFSTYARTVTMLVRGNSLASAMSAYLIDEMRTRANIVIELESEMVAARGSGHLDEIDVRNNATGETTTRKTSFVFVFIGADAETGWMPSEVARDNRGYVITGLRAADAEHCALMKPWPLERDPYHLETSVPGIFAAGDVRAASVKRCASGVGEGSMAIAFVHQYLEEATRKEKAGAPA